MIVGSFSVSGTLVLIVVQNLVLTARLVFGDLPASKRNTMYYLRNRTNNELMLFNCNQFAPGGMLHVNEVRVEGYGETEFGFGWTNENGRSPEICDESPTGETHKCGDGKNLRFELIGERWVTLNGVVHKGKLFSGKEISVVQPVTVH